MRWNVAKAKRKNEFRVSFVVVDGLPTVHFDHASLDRLSVAKIENDFAKCRLSQESDDDLGEQAGLEPDADHP